MIGHARLALSLLFALGLVAGCGSTETKDDPKGEVIARPVEDPPRSVTNGDPPLGKPKSKVEPAIVTHVNDMKKSDSLYRDETPH